MPVSEMAVLIAEIKQTAAKRHVTYGSRSVPPKVWLDIVAEDFGFENWAHAVACLADAKRGFWAVTEWPQTSDG